MIKSESTLNKFLFGILFIMTLAGVWARIEGFLIHRSFWLDEAMYANNLLEINYSNIFTGKGLLIGSPAPLFLFFTKAFIDSIFIHESIFRLIPLVSSFATLVVGYIFFKKLFGRSHAILILFFISTSPILIRYCNEYKQYSSDLFFSTILLGTSIWVIKTNYKAKSILIWTVLCAIALWFSHTAIFLVGGMGLSLAICPLKKKEWIRTRYLIFSGTLLLGNLLIVYFINIRVSTNSDSLIEYHNDYYWPLIPRSLEDILFYKNTIFRLMMNAIHASLIIPGIFLYLSGLLLTYKRNKTECLILVIPILLLIITSASQKYPMQDRLLIFTYPLIFLPISSTLSYLHYKTNYLLLSLLLISFFLPDLYPEYKTRKTPIYSRINETCPI